MGLRKISSAGNRYFVILCIMGAFAILSSTMSKSPVLNPFATKLGTPTDLIGLVASASTIPGILISLPAASLSDIVGRRKVLLFSAFVFASAPFLYLFVATWWQLALVRFYHGFATAVFVPVTEATVAELFLNKRGERISIINSITGIGRTIAPILGGAILTAGGTILVPINYNFYGLYLAVAIAGLTAFILTFLLLTETGKPTENKARVRDMTKEIFSGWRKIIQNRAALIVSFVQATQYYVFGAIEFFIVGFMFDVAKLDAFFSGTFLTVEVATIIVARPFLGRLSDKWGRKNPILLGTILSGFLVLAVPFATQFWILLLIAAGYGLGFASVVSSTSPFMSEIAPAGLVGASMGFLATIMDVGQTIGPIAGGIILGSNKEYGWLFGSLGVLLLASAAIFGFAEKKRKTDTMLRRSLEELRSKTNRETGTL